MQQKLDEPLQYFFNHYNLEIEDTPRTLTHPTKLPQKPLYSIGITKYIKLVALPSGSRNKLQIRLENLYDQFDRTKMNKSDCYINEADLVVSIWKLANQDKTAGL